MQTEILPGKGKKDGRCNRTACQRSLAGEPQWTMSDHQNHTDGRLYYCQSCAFQFNDWDDKCGVPRRCRPEPFEASHV